MKAQTKVAALAAASILCAGVAYAAPAQLNIYGASAQGDFWVAEAYPFLTSLGCKAADGKSALPTGNDANGKITMPTSKTKIKYGYAAGFNCTNTKIPVNPATGQRDLEIRSAGIASLEGPLSVNGGSPLGEPDTECNTNGGNRMMLTGATVSDSMANLGCYRVHVGTADLKVENINQSATDENYTPYPMPDPAVTQGTLQNDPSIIVPFSFAVNKAVKARGCYDGDDHTKKLNENNCCTTDAQCGKNAAGHLNWCNTTSETITNLSREMAVQLFAGQVYNWQDLGQCFDSLPVTVCVRIPGSGTHASLEKMVMTAGDSKNPAGSFWGNTIINTANPNADCNGSLPYVNYVKSSDNMVDCINNTAGVACGNGAVGYLDCDKNDFVLAANAVKVCYNGAQCSRVNIRKGAYDFFAAGQMYHNGYPLRSELVAFVNDPTKIPGTINDPAHAVGAGTVANPYWLSVDMAVSTKAVWWASPAEMLFTRDLDLNYPTRVTPAKYVNP